MRARFVVVSLAALCACALQGALGLMSSPALAAGEACPNEQFRTGPSASLPDCRAYEQVTPVNKEGANDMFLDINTISSSGAFGQATDQGDKVVLTTSSAFGPAPDGFNAQSYVFSRSSSGWQFAAVEPPDAGDAFYALAASVFSSDLSRVATNSYTASSASLSPSTPENLVVGAVGGPYAPIATTTNGNVPQGPLVGASADLSHVIFTTLDHSLVPAAAGQVAGSNALYEWTGGQLRLVNVTTGGSLTSACGAMLGGGTLAGATHDAVSSDGSRVFFESPDPFAVGNGASDPSCSQPQHLYMRVNGSETVDVSAPNPGVNDPNGFQPVGFVGAAADGSRVFFVTKTELTADDTTHAPELYEYDTGSGKLTRVSRGVSGGAEGDVQWALVSEDGSTVYFAAAGQLAPGAPALTPPPGGMQVNLYRYDTATGATRYIATIDGEKDGEQAVPSAPEQGPFGSLELLARSNWYTTPDGRFLLFGSTADITGYNPTSSCVNEFHDPGCLELYRYDSGDGSLTCVSCPGESPAVGSAEFTMVGRTLGDYDIRPPRPISDDGSRVFFDTPEQLLPQDTNHRRDVYEWEADGAGSCHSSAQDGGCLYLISSGKDTTDATFIDSSSDGSNVFFGTHAQLAPTDTDSKGDLYDARVDGGFPAPPPAPSCSGEGCQGAPSTPFTALLAAPSSTVFSGSGNVVSQAIAPKKKTAKKHKAKKHRKHSKHRGRHARRGK
jgi:hypothetical protein